MTDLLNEFDERKYPFRYRMNVGATGADRTVRWLKQAADQLGLEASFVARKINVHPDPEIRGSTDIGIGLTTEDDYEILVAEFDRLAIANYEASITAQTEWEMRVAEFQTQHPNCVNPELVLIAQEQAADEKAREERGIERDDFGLEM